METSDTFVRNGDSWYSANLMQLETPDTLIKMEISGNLKIGINGDVWYLNWNRDS